MKPGHSVPAWIVSEQLFVTVDLTFRNGDIPPKLIPTANAGNYKIASILKIQAHLPTFEP